MFFRDTVVTANYYEYKFLVEIVCCNRGYSFIPDKRGNSRVVDVQTVVGAACRFVYQTLRVIPISRLYYETQTPANHSEREILTAITKLYSSQGTPVQNIIDKNNLPCVRLPWHRAPEYIKLLEGGLMDDIIQEVNSIVPRLFNGEPVLSIYAHTPKLRQGLRDRYRHRNLAKVMEFPELLDQLEMDFCDWCGNMSIDADRVDAYVVESVVGSYMGRFFFPWWDKYKLREYTEGRQRIAYEGNMLDVSSTESIALIDDPNIDFHQTMVDLRTLSVQMFGHSTAQAKNSDNLDLQYSVLEWYTELKFKKYLDLLNQYYVLIQRGQLDRMDDILPENARSSNMLQLSTEYGVFRTRQIDNTMKARIKNNRDFLTMVYSKYADVKLETITGDINSRATSYSMMMTRDKMDSNYPFFKPGLDICPIATFFKPESRTRQNVRVSRILQTMHPEIRPDTKGEVTDAQLRAIVSKNINNVVTDEGYKKYALVIRALRELDNLSEFLENHGMSIADICGVNYLTTEYYEIISDLDGMLYDRLVTTWRDERGSVEEAFDDGYNATVVSWLSNVEVLDLLKTKRSNTLPSKVDRKTIGVVDRDIAYLAAAKQLPLLRVSLPNAFVTEREVNAGLARINLRFRDNSVFSETNVTAFELYNNSALNQVIWEETLKFISNYSVENLAYLLGDMVMLLYLLDKIMGAQSALHQEFIEELNKLSQPFRFSIVNTLGHLRLNSVGSNNPADAVLNKIVQSVLDQKHVKEPKDYRWGYTDVSKYLGRIIMSYGPKGPLKFVFERVIFDKSGPMLGGMPISSTQLRNLLADCRLKYKDDKGISPALKRIESEKEGALSLTTICYMYYKYTHLITRAYLDKCTLQDLRIFTRLSRPVNIFWMQKDLLLARQMCLNLISDLYSKYVVKINTVISCYNEEQRDPKSSYKIFASLNAAAIIGDVQTLQSRVAELSDAYQELKSGAPEETILTVLDSLDIAYVRSATAVMCDPKYNRMIQGMMLSGVYAWFSNMQLSANITQVQDSLLKIKDSVKKELDLERVRSKSFNVNKQAQLTNYVLTQILSDKTSVLSDKYRTMLISGNRVALEEKIEQLYGSSINLIPADSNGFIKNQRGDYFSAVINNKHLAFLNKVGIVFICDAKLESVSVADTRICYVTDLGDDVTWG